MSEATEQQTVVDFCDLKRIPIFAIPNGGRRDAKEAFYMKRSGVKAGVPDLCIPVPRGGYHGLFIEMKVGKNKPTELQVEWIDRLNHNGYKAVVCYGAKNAIEVITEYYYD